MKKYILFLPALIICLLIPACSAPSGCRIDGTVRDVSFEGKTVYLRDVYNRSVIYDSVQVVQGKFHFTDSMDIASPYMRLLSLPAHESGAYELPVVMENGHITAALGEIVCTSGTPLNDRLQDFLLGMDEFLDSMHKEKDWSEERMKARFSEFIEGHVTTNADNMAGVYIYRIYHRFLADEAGQSLLDKHPLLKEQVEK